MNNSKSNYLTAFLIVSIVIVSIRVVLSESQSFAFKNNHAAKTKLFFWYTVNPGFPPKTEWKQGDSAISLYKEMQYGNMKSRPGSKEYFKRLKELGFDAIVLNGFHGPYKPEIKMPVFPNDLENFLQSRNYKYYIPWAKEYGLEPFLQVMFFSQGSAKSFSWFDDSEWKNIEVFLGFVAKVAKLSGCKGISFDFEPYYDFIKKNPWRMIKLDNSLKRQNNLQLIQKRASQMASAIHKEFPEAEIHLYDIGAGANSLFYDKIPSKPCDLIGDDYSDIVAYFLAGFLSQRFEGGIHIDEASSYYVYDPVKLETLYKSALIKYKDNVLVRWNYYKDYMEKNFSVGLALVVHHRWDRKEYWDKIKHIDNSTLQRTLEALLLISPYIWVYPGETDWIYPEIADQLPIPHSTNIAETPYKNHSERMTAFTSFLKKIKEINVLRKQF